MICLACTPLNVLVSSDAQDFRTNGEISRSQEQFSVIIKQCGQ